MDNCFPSRQKGRLGATSVGVLAVTVASVFAAPAPGSGQHSVGAIDD
jgi:hypothetical protein